MKSTGIVRKTNSLGRLIIPKEIRKSLQLNENEPMEIYVDGEYIIAKRYSPGCLLCGEIENTIVIHKKKVCKQCISELMEQGNKSK